MPGISKYVLLEPFRDRRICGSQIFNSRSTTRNTRLSKSRVRVSLLFVMGRTSSPTFPWKSIHWKSKDPPLHSWARSNAGKGRGVDSRYWFPIRSVDSTGNRSVHIYDWKLRKCCLCTSWDGYSRNRTTSCGQGSSVTMPPYQRSMVESSLFRLRCTCSPRSLIQKALLEWSVSRSEVCQPHHSRRGQSCCSKMVGSCLEDRPGHQHLSYSQWEVACESWSRVG